MWVVVKDHCRFLVLTPWCSLELLRHRIRYLRWNQISGRSADEAQVTLRDDNPDTQVDFRSPRRSSFWLLSWWSYNLPTQELVRSKWSDCLLRYHLCYTYSYCYEKFRWTGWYFYVLNYTTSLCCRGRRAWLRWLLFIASLGRRNLASNRTSCQVLDCLSQRVWC